MSVGGFLSESSITYMILNCGVIIGSVFGILVDFSCNAA